MYAVVIDGKFTGTVYDEITQNVADWCEQYGASLVRVDVELENLGTDEEPDYGSPTQAQLNQQRVVEIDSELIKIDSEAIRPLRAIQAGTDTQFDRDKLTDLDLQAEILRTERKELTQ